MAIDDAISGGEHATPTPATHVPMNGSGGKALLLDMVRTVRHSAGPVGGPGPVVSTMSTPPNPNPVTNPEKNAVDIAKIEAGLDTRTTVMLKVLPLPPFLYDLETGWRLMHEGGCTECSQQDVQLRVAAVYMGCCPSEL